MPPARPGQSLVLLVVVVAMGVVYPAALGTAQDEEGGLADRVIERYKQILRTSPRELGAFDRLYDLYSERSSVQVLLDEYTALTLAEPDEPSHWIILGHITKRRGDREQAGAAYLKAAARAPNDPYPRQMLGDVSVRRREWAKAAAAYEEAIERQPPLDDRIAVLKALGRCHSELGDRERAVQTWNTIVELDPKSVFTRLELAELYRDLRLFDEAIAQYEGIVAIQSDDPYWVCKARIEIGRILEQLDRTAEALQAFEQALALTASDSWLRDEIVALIGELFRSRNDLDGLADCYRAKLDKNPKDTEAIVQLAKALSEMGRDDEAVAQYVQGLEHAPSSVPLRTALIELLADVGRYDEAVPHAQRLVKDDPKTIDHHRVLGELLYHAGRLDEAKEALRGVLTGGSSDPNRHLALAELYAQYDFVDEAVAAYEAAVRLAPDNGDYVIALGEYYASLFRADQALATFHRLVEGEGRATAANTSRLAEVLDQHGFAEAAIEAAKRAVELAPGDFQLGDRYARQLVAHDRADEALAVLEALLARAPNEFFRADIEDRIFGILRRQGTLQERIAAAEGALGPQPDLQDLLRLARMYAKTGDTAKELASLERARTSVPNSVEVLRRLAHLRQRQGETAEAIKINEQLVELDANNAREYLETIASLYIFLGQEQEARETAKRVIARRPKEPNGHALLARVEFRFQHTDEAIDALHEAIARRPKSPDLHQELSRLYEGAGRTDEAIEELWKCWELEESGLGRITYVHELATLYRNEDRLDELKERLRAIGRQARRDPFAQLALAEVERTSGDLEAAKRELARLHTRQPKDTDTLLQLVAVCRELGELDEAIRYQARVTELDPSQSNQRTLGQLLYEAGREAEAVETWSKLTKERASDPRSYLELAKLFIQYDLDDAALDVLAKADRLETDQWRTLYEVAELYEALGQWTKAAGAYGRLLELPDEEQTDAKAPPYARSAGFSRSWRGGYPLSAANTGSELLDRLLMLDQVAQLLFSEQYRGSVAWSPTSLAEAKTAAYVKLVCAHQLAGSLEQFEQVHAPPPGEDGRDVEALTARVEFLYVLGQSDRCLELLDALIAIAPDEPGYRIASAHLASKLGDAGRLEAAYRALAEKEQSQAAQYLDGLIRALVSQHDEEKLEQYIGEVLALTKAKKLNYGSAVNMTIAAGMADRTRELIDAMLADKDAHPSSMYSVATALVNNQEFDLGSSVMAEIEKRVSEADSSGMSFAHLYQQAAEAAQRTGHLDRACEHALRYLEASSPKRERTPQPKPGAGTWSQTCSALRNRFVQRSVAYRPSSGGVHPYLSETGLYDYNRIRMLVLAVQASHALGDDGRVRQALEQWAEGAEGPAKLDPLVGLSYVAFLYGDLEQAGVYVNRAIEVDPDNPWLFVLKAHVLWLRGDYAAVLSELEQRAQQDGEVPQEVLTTMLSAADSVGLDEWTDRIAEKLLETKLPAGSLCSMAEEMLRRGRRDPALELVARAAEAAGNDVNELQRVAWLFARLGDQARAVEIAARLLDQALSPGQQFYESGSQPARVSAAVSGALDILHGAGRRDEVISVLKQAERSARTASELCALAEMHRRLGDPEGHLALLDRIARLGRGDAFALLATADALWQSGRADLALALYKTVLIRSPDVARHNYHQLLQCFFDSGRHDELVEIVLKISRHATSPGSFAATGYGSSLLEQIAYECSSRGLIEQAITILEHTMRIAPEAAPRVCSRLAQLYLESGQPEKAIALLEAQMPGRARSARPALYASRQSMQYDLYDLVRAHRQLGTFDRLIQRVADAVEANPYDDSLRQMLVELYLYDSRPAEARAVAEAPVPSGPGRRDTGDSNRLVGQLINQGFHEDAAAICEAQLERCRAEGRTDLGLLSRAASAYLRAGDMTRVRALCAEIRAGAEAGQDMDSALVAARVLQQCGAFDDAFAICKRLAACDLYESRTRNTDETLLALAIRTQRLDELLAAVPDTIAPIDEGRYAALAESLYTMRYYREAARIHKRLLGSTPRNANARVQLVSCLEAMGDREQAAEHLVVLARDYPTETEYLPRLAGLYEHMKQDAEQEATLKALVERDPSSNNYERLAAFYTSAKRFDEAIAVRARRVELQPGDASALYNLGHAYLAAGNKEKAVEVWRAIPTIDPSATGWLTLATSLNAAGLGEEAIAACDKAAALEPRDRDTLRSLGSIYRDAGDHDGAAAVWRMIPTITNTAAAWVELGRALDGIGRKEEARAAYETALTLQPGDYPALQALTGVLTAAGQYEKACDVVCRGIEQAWWSRSSRDMVSLATQIASSARDQATAAALRLRLADALAGMDSAPKLFRADALIQSARSWPSSDEEGKLRVLHKALELGEPCPRILQSVASTLSGMGKHDEAVALYRRLAQHDPWEQWNGLAVVRELAKAGLADEARQELDRLADEARRADQLARVAQAYADSLNDQARALALYERAAKMAPTNTSVAHQMAELLIKLDRKPDALAVLERAAQLSPNADTYRGFADLLARHEAGAEAETFYRRAIEAEPRNANQVITLGRFLEKDGRRDEALAIYQKAREAFSAEEDRDRLDEEIKRLKGVS